MCIINTCRYSTNFSIVVPSSPITPQSTAVANITVTPNAGFIGQEDVTFFTYDPAQVDLTGVDVTTGLLRSSSTIFDIQTITVESLGLDLLPASDSGASDSDNITNVSDLTFAISGVTPGATVTLRGGDTVLGIGNATSSTIELTANVLAVGGEGVHDFTVTQTIGGVESNRTPALAVTYDATGPLFSSTPVSTTVGGEQLTYDAQTNDEAGAGASYLRVDPVTGDPLTSEPGDPIIDPVTGIFVWTPGAADIGTSSHAIRASDLAGNTTTQTFDLAVTQPPTIRFRLEVTKGGQVVSAANPLLTGDDFQLNAYAQDLRVLDDPASGGVFAAYLDVLFDAGLAMIAGAITNGPDFQSNEFNAGITSTPGLIDHAGHFAAATSPTGQDEQLLWTAPLTAAAEAEAGAVVALYQHAQAEPPAQPRRLFQRRRVVPEFDPGESRQLGVGRIHCCTLDVPRSGMLPVPGVVRAAWRQAEDVAVSVDAQAEHRAVGVGEVGDHLVDLQDLAVLEAGFAQGLDRACREVARRSGQAARVVQGGQLPALEGRARIFRLQRRAHGGSAGIVGKQAAKPLKMVFDAVGAGVEHGDIDPECFEQPFGQPVGAVVQHILVQVHVPFHAVRAQAVRHHDIVDIVVGALDAVVQGL